MSRRGITKHQIASLRFAKKIGWRPNQIHTFGGLSGPLARLGPLSRFFTFVSCSSHNESVISWRMSLSNPWRQPGVRSGGRVVERRTVNRGDGGSIPPTAVSKLSVIPHLPVSFGRDTKSRWSLLSSVYARGSTRSHTGSKCVTCSGLTNSREELLR